jgi:hypothetical protein
MWGPGFGFELAKFFREERLDFPLRKAEVQGLGHKLLNRRRNLAAARLEP